MGTQQNFKNVQLHLVLPMHGENNYRQHKIKPENQYDPTHKGVNLPLPGKPSSAGGIDNMLAVDAEHKHGAILSQKVNNQYTNTTTGYIIKTTKQKKTPKMFYLRSVDPLFHDGDLVSEDGSIVLNHHGLFFHVSSSKQAQALCGKLRLNFWNKQHGFSQREASLPGCVSEPGRR